MSGGDVVLVADELDRVGVADDVAGEAELVAEALGQPVVAAGDGDAVVIVVRATSRPSPCLRGTRA